MPDEPSSDNDRTAIEKSIFEYLALSDDDLFANGKVVPPHIQQSYKYKERLVKFSLALPAESFLERIPKMTERMLRKKEIQDKLNSSVEQYLENHVTMTSSQVCRVQIHSGQCLY